MPGPVDPRLPQVLGGSQSPQIAQPSALPPAGSPAIGGGSPSPTPMFNGVGGVKPPLDPEIENLKKIFPDKSEEELIDMHKRASNPEQYTKSSGAPSVFNALLNSSPQAKAAPIDPYQNMNNRIQGKAYK